MIIALADGSYGCREWIKLKHVMEFNASWLYSFYYTTAPSFRILREMNLGAKGCYLDSGVYTARKKGKIIPMQKLVDFYKEFPDLISWVFSMDSGNEVEQLNNIINMANDGVPTIGIWHGPEHSVNTGCVMPFEYIDRIAEVTDYIALGNGGFKYLDAFFEYIYKRNLTNLKTHLLGYISPNVLTRYPFYSADSSTITLNAGFGRVTTYIDSKIKIKCLVLSQLVKKDNKNKMNLSSIRKKSRRIMRVLKKCLKITRI